MTRTHKNEFNWNFKLSTMLLASGIFLVSIVYNINWFNIFNIVLLGLLVLWVPVDEAYKQEKQLKINRIIEDK